jgi:cobalt-zinc-cadmium efflux system outer membrane protein
LEGFIMSIPRRCTHVDRRRNARAIIACFALLIASARPSRGLTLAEALDAALAANPDLAALEHEQRALAAAVEQARLLPNPELQTEVENVAGTGGREADEAAESTIRVTQRLELGGKRSARTQIAASAAEAAAAGLVLRRRDVTATVKTAFAAALAAQQRLALARDLERVASDALGSAESAVRAGAMSSAERDRARLVALKADSLCALRDRQAATARATLAATWGDAAVTFGELVGRLDGAIVLPARKDVLSSTFADHPIMIRADALVAERTATASLARANRLPDVTIAAGGRHFNDDDDVAAVFALSAPLPLFDRNQGALAEAEARLAQAREERRSAEAGLRASLATAYDQYVTAEEQRVLLDAGVLPAAARAVETTTAGHRDGLLPYHDVLDARRMLYELETDRVDRLEERFAAAVELERISGLTLIDASKGDPR